MRNGFSEKWREKTITTFSKIKRNRFLLVTSLPDLVPLTHSKYNSCYWTCACCHIFPCWERNTNEVKGSIQSRIDPFASFACKTADNCNKSFSHPRVTVLCTILAIYLSFFPPKHFFLINHKNYNFLDCDWLKKIPVFY